MLILLYSMVRERVAYALSRLGDHNAVEPLINALKVEENGSVCVAISNALVALNSVDSLLEELLLLLNHSDQYTCWAAIPTLAKIRDDRVIELIINALQDPVATVRETAAMVLKDFSDERAFQALLIALKDPDSSVRYCAISSLRECNDRRAIEPLMDMLNDSDSMIRHLAQEIAARLQEA